MRSRANIKRRELDMMVLATVIGRVKENEELQLGVWRIREIIYKNVCLWRIPNTNVTAIHVTKQPGTKTTRSHTTEKTVELKFLRNLFKSYQNIGHTVDIKVTWGQSREPKILIKRTRTHTNTHTCVLLASIVRVMETR